MLEFLKTLKEPGVIAECGVFKGVSSYLIASSLVQQRKNEKPLEFHIFDSFEGLSARSEKDHISGKNMATEGMMSCTLEEVRRNLSEFDFIKYHKGWIPQCFEDIDNDKKFSFVFIDLDLYEPIKGSLEFFYPRLTTPGFIVVDDYGVKKWPGVLKAVEEFVGQNECFCIRSTVGIAVTGKWI